ncbi:hypothetical protein BASA61_006710 [Batrachochytrium salamandrivorans]|nr:hypothetical protein BASA61_006710 [Batrachochytrium salamandrivorans]
MAAFHMVSKPTRHPESTHAARSSSSTNNRIAAIETTKATRHNAGDSDRPSEKTVRCRSLPPLVPGRPRSLLVLHVTGIRWTSPSSADTRSRLSTVSSRPLNISSTLSSSPLVQPTFSNPSSSSNIISNANTNTKTTSTMDHGRLRQACSLPRQLTPTDTAARVRWWGAHSSDLLLPLSSRTVLLSESNQILASDKIKTDSVLSSAPSQLSDGSDLADPADLALQLTITYHVCCSLKQFTTYLADMGSLEIEILRKSRPVGHISIKDISAKLSGSLRSFTDHLPIRSQRSTRRDIVVGSACVSMELRPISASTITNTAPTAILAESATSRTKISDSNSTDINPRQSTSLTLDSRCHDDIQSNPRDSVGAINPSRSSSGDHITLGQLPATGLHSSMDDNALHLPSNLGANYIWGSKGNTQAKILSSNHQLPTPILESSLRHKEINHDTLAVPDLHLLPKDNYSTQDCLQHDESGMHGSKLSEWEKQDLLDNIERYALQLKSSLDQALPSAELGGLGSTNPPVALLESGTNSSWNTPNITNEALHEDSLDYVPEMDNISHLESTLGLDAYSSNESLERVLNDDFVIEALKTEAGKRLLDKRSTTGAVNLGEEDSFQLSSSAETSDYHSESCSDNESADGRVLKMLHLKPTSATPRANSRHALLAESLFSHFKSVRSCHVILDSFILLPSKQRPDTIWVEYVFPAFNQHSPVKGRLRMRPEAANIKQPAAYHPASRHSRSLAEEKSTKGHDVYIADEPITLPVSFINRDQLMLLTDELIQLKLIGLMSKGRGKWGTGTKSTFRRKGDPVSNNHLSSESNQLWVANGIIRCKDLLLSKRLQWQGKVDFWAAERSRLPRPISGSAKTILSATSAYHDNISQRDPLSSHIGDMNMTVEFISEKSMPEAHVPLPTQVSPSALHLTTASDIPLKSTRALSIEPQPSSDSVFLYLVIRLFSSSTLPIQTAPIVYRPPFDITTGKLNEPSDFKFSSTLPLAFTDEFLKAGAHSPIIAEIHAIRVANSSSTIWASEMRSRGKTNLVGLIRLPLPQLIAAVLSSKAHLDIRGSGDDDQTPILIPDTEYAILDPFAGTAKGWVTAFMAVGTWSQINHIRQGEAKHMVSANTPEDTAITLPTMQIGNACSPIPTRDPPPGLDAEVSIPLSLHKQHHDDSSFEASRPCNDQDDHDDSGVLPDCDTVPAECCIEVGIHSACGILGLLRCLPSDFSGITDEALQLAKEVGADVFVTLVLFPEDTDFNNTGMNGNEHSIDTMQDPSIICTQLVPKTFSPVYHHQVELTVCGLDTDLISWIRSGGTAHGKIWHRVPSHLSPTGISKDILLGTFLVPLDALLLRKSGIHNQWVYIQPVSSPVDTIHDPSRASSSLNGSSGAIAAVQISVRFRTGMELGEFSDELDRSIGIHDASVIESPITSMKLAIDISEVDLADSDRSHYGDLDLSTARMLIRWKYPLVQNSTSSGRFTVQWKTEESEAVLWNQTWSSGVWKLDYHKSIVLRLTKEIVVYFRDHFWEAQVILMDIQGREWPAGSIWVDFSLLIDEARIANRSGRRNSSVNSVRLGSRRGSGDQFIKQKNQSGAIFAQHAPLIQEVSNDLGGAVMHIRLKLDVMRTSKLFETTRKEQIAHISIVKTPVAADVVCNASLQHSEISSLKPSTNAFLVDTNSGSVEIPPALTVQEESRISIHISVERATHLPLMDDPFADSMVSPFVRVSETKTIPPNSFVAFSWPSSPLQFDGERTDYQSRVIGALTNPTWCYQTKIEVSRTRRAVNILKTEGYLDFYVHHVPNLNAARYDNSGIQVNEETKKDLIGIARVAFHPLFGGMSEINGWYPVKDASGAICGQLMVRIFPSECLSTALKELSPKPPSLQSQDTHKLLNRSQVYRQRVPSSDEILPAGIAIAPPRTQCRTDLLRSTGPADAGEFLAAAVSAAAARECNTLQPVHSVDTWVWTGRKWEHRQVKVQSPATEDVNPDDTPVVPAESSIVVPSTETCTTLKTKTGRVVSKKSLTETLKDLDQLRESMYARLSEISHPQHDAKSTATLSRSIPVASLDRKTISSSAPKDTQDERCGVTCGFGKDDPTLAAHSLEEMPKSSDGALYTSVKGSAPVHSPTMVSWPIHTSSLPNPPKSIGEIHSEMPTMDIKSVLHVDEDDISVIQTPLKTDGATADFIPIAADELNSYTVRSDDAKSSNEETLSLLRSAYRIEAEAERVLGKCVTVNMDKEVRIDATVDVVEDDISECSDSSQGRADSGSGVILFAKRATSNCSEESLELDVLAVNENTDDEDTEIGELAQRSLRSVVSGGNSHIPTNRVLYPATGSVVENESPGRPELIETLFPKSTVSVQLHVPPKHTRTLWKSLDSNSMLARSTSSTSSLIESEPLHRAESSSIAVQSLGMGAEVDLTNSTEKLASSSSASRSTTAWLDEKISSLPQSSIDRMAQVFRTSTLSDTTTPELSK